MASSDLPDLVDLQDLPPGTSQEAADAASAAVRAYCGWHIAPSITETQTVDGPGGWLLVLPTLYLTELTDVTSDENAVDDPEWSESGLVRHRWWSQKFRGVTATMTHGYDDCPAVIVGVVGSMASRGVAGPGASMTVAGPFTMQYSTGVQGGATGIFGTHLAALAPYRLPGLA
jgi:hypothetical protein